jgi:hypothetical protein
MLKMGEISNWADHRFKLTSSGWRSPTLRDRGLQSIADFYDEMGSNFSQRRRPVMAIDDSGREVSNERSDEFNRWGNSAHTIKFQARGPFA